MPNPRSGTAEQRGKIIKLLETAMTLAEDVEDGTTAYLIGARWTRRGRRLSRRNLECRGPPTEATMPPNCA